MYIYIKIIDFQISSLLLILNVSILSIKNDDVRIENGKVLHIFFPDNLQTKNEWSSDLTAGGLKFLN